MVYQLVLPHRTIACLIKPSRKARHLRLAVFPDGSVTVSLPRNATVDQAVAFVERKAPWIAKKLERWVAIHQAGPKPALDPGQLKVAAMALVDERLKHFNREYGFKYGKVRIKNHKSMWGSCSRAGNLNFCYKIAALPPDLADYIIVHELCHLGEFSHSPRFWDLVSRAVPNHKQLQSRLLEQQIRLT